MAETGCGSKTSPTGGTYETFDHGADVGIRGIGPTPEAAFEAAARALFSLMVDVERVEPREAMSIQVEAPDRELLLVEWLNHLLSLAHLKGVVFSRFQVGMNAEGTTLRAQAWGEPLDARRHLIHTEAKAATYTALRVESVQGQWIAQCVVDV